MSTVQTLAHPERMRIAGSDGRSWQGGSQEWYTRGWQRRAGCGPTNGSNLVWYLSRTRPALQGLWPSQGGDRRSFLLLMEEMFRHITPGLRGVNTLGMFVDGARSFAAKREISLGARTLEIPAQEQRRPGPDQVGAFVYGALRDDLPVAFLNLSNGSERLLDSWHWVTLWGIDPATMKARMLDQGSEIEINLGLWLRTTRMGGGLVALEPAEPRQSPRQAQGTEHE